MLAVLLACACGKTEAPPQPQPPVVAKAAPVFAVAPIEDRYQAPIDPKKVPRDLLKALAYHEQQCRDQELSSCLEIARMANEGIGSPRDVTKAKGFLRLACDGGSRRACHQMLTFEPEPATQLEIDHVIGHHQLECMESQRRDECAILGDIYRLGEFVRPDLRRAAILYARACDADDPVGCNNLGAMRALGEGSHHDEAEAKVLFTKACSYGSREGCLNAGIDPAHPPKPIERR